MTENHFVPWGEAPSAAPSAPRKEERFAPTPAPAPDGFFAPSPEEQPAPSLDWTPLDSGSGALARRIAGLAALGIAALVYPAFLGIPAACLATLTLCRVWYERETDRPIGVRDMFVGIRRAARRGSPLVRFVLPAALFSVPAAAQYMLLAGQGSIAWRLGALVSLAGAAAIASSAILRHAAQRAEGEAEDHQDQLYNLARSRGMRVIDTTTGEEIRRG